MPSLKVYLNDKLYAKLIEFYEEGAFNSKSAALLHLAHLGLKTTLPRPHDDPTCTPTRPHSTRESIDLNNNLNNQSSVVGGENDPKATPSKPLTEKQESVRGIVEQATKMILDATGNKSFNANVRESIISVEQLIRLDGVSRDDILPGLRWALNDPFWGKLLCSIKQWRKKPSGTAKFWNMVQKWKIETDPTKDMTTKEYYAQGKPKVEKREMTDDEFKDWANKSGIPTVDEHYEKIAEESRRKSQKTTQGD